MLSVCVVCASDTSRRQSPGSLFQLAHRVYSGLHVDTDQASVGNISIQLVSKVVLCQCDNAMFAHIFRAHGAVQVPASSASGMLSVCICV